MPASCNHRPTQARSAAEIAAALAHAERRCLSGGEQWTQPRRRTLEMLLRSPMPLKAYDLIGGFGGTSPTSPPTVYRALAFLEARGLVHRVATINAYAACTGGERPHSAAFLICDCCGAATELPLDPAVTAQAARRHGFEVHATVLEGRGRCRSCT